MGERVIPPPINSAEVRFDAIIDELRAIRALLTPVETSAPQDGEVVELREPETKTAVKAKRT